MYMLHLWYVSISPLVAYGVCISLMVRIGLGGNSTGHEVPRVLIFVSLAQGISIWIRMCMFHHDRRLSGMVSLWQCENSRLNVERLGRSFLYTSARLHQAQWFPMTAGD